MFLSCDGLAPVLQRKSRASWELKSYTNPGLSDASGLTCPDP